MLVSRRFVATLKLHPEPAYRLARRAGVHPTTLSKLVHGAEPIRPQDARVIAVARELGLTPEECFSQDAAESPQVA
jgi:DNA-binding transcriptional regulator YdaS (Cro superfamily)